MPYTHSIMTRREMYNPAEAGLAGMSGVPGAARVARMAASSILAMALLASSACDDSATTDPAHGQNSQLVLTASFQQIGAANEQLKVASSYRLSTGSTVVMSSQSFALDGSQQQIPVTIDIGRCLADDQRAGMNGAAPGAGQCVATLSVQWILNGISVDSQSVGPVSLSPGSVTVVPNPIQLNAISEVRIVTPSENVTGPGEPLRLEVGKSLTLVATVSDREGQPVSGRKATWTSSNASVAAVSAEGVVAALAEGTARVTADVGGFRSFVDVVTVYPPSMLTISAAGRSGSGKLTSSPGGLDCTISGDIASGTCAYLFAGGTVVTLSARSLGDASEFASWSGDCANAEGTSCIITMDRETNVGVAFRALRTLNVDMTGAGSGSVNSSEGEINCNYAHGNALGACVSTFSDETEVVLSAAATSPGVFAGWTGECASVTGSICRVDMDAARSVTARFELPVSLSIAGAGYGSGMVESDPSGISCTLSGSSGTGICSGFFLSGNTVTLLANAASGSTFREWIGCTSSVGTSCTVVLPGSDESISVRFDPPPVLSVSLSGNGAGKVVSSTGIVCTRIDFTNLGNCSNVESHGSEVLLTATADPSSIFEGWSGACSGTGECRVTMDESRTVGAAFTIPTVGLTLVMKGPGPGSILLNGQQVCSRNEGAADKICEIPVELNSTVYLQALPGSGYKVSGFSGLCGSSGAECEFTVTSPGSVVVSFGATQVSFSASAGSSSTGSGWVRSGILDFNCYIFGATVPYPYNCARTLSPSVFAPSLLLQAEPDSISQFDGWGGACSTAGMSPTCTLSNPLAAVSVLASFSPRMVAVAVDLSGEDAAGTITASGTGWNRTCTLSASATSASCTWLIPAGQPFTVMPTSGSGYFTGNPGSLCYYNEGTCSVSYGIVSDTSLSYYFFSY